MFEKDYNLQKHHTFNCPVKARYFSGFTSVEELNCLRQQPEFHQHPPLILGGGSNVLFTEDFNGLVLHNQINSREVRKRHNDCVWLTLGAGEHWHDIVCYCVKQGYYGIENLSLIPGTVGAAPIQNIGAYGVQLDEVFDHLEAVHLSSGQKRLFSKEECEFGYRDSIFKQALKNQYCITHVTLKLHLKPQLTTHYPALQHYLTAHKIEPTLHNVHQAVINIRSSKLPCPKTQPNAGSFFKNPIMSAEQFHNIKARHPHIPFYPVGENHYKIPAAWLIEACHFKGSRQGPVGVHPKHALVLVNYEAGNGKNIIDLAQSIQQSVHAMFNIELENEVNIISS